jgi:hypothetical protein
MQRLRSCRNILTCEHLTGAEMRRARGSCEATASPKSGRPSDRARSLQQSSHMRLIRWDTHRHNQDPSMNLETVVKLLYNHKKVGLPSKSTQSWTRADTTVHSGPQPPQGHGQTDTKWCSSPTTPAWGTQRMQLAALECKGSMPRCPRRKAIAPGLNAFPPIVLGLRMV